MNPVQGVTPQTLEYPTDTSRTLIQPDCQRHGHALPQRQVHLFSCGRHLPGNRIAIPGQSGP